MDSDIAPTAQEEGQPHEPPAKTTGPKRKFASQAQFESLQSTVADMRSEMAVLISLFKESVSPSKKPCLDGGSQSASNSMLTVLSTENQFLAPPHGNQFAMPSCGDQFSTAYENSAYDASALPIIRKLGWPTINELIESETLKMVYKSVHDQAPIYLADMFDKLSDLDKRELRNTKTDLAVPHRKSALGQKCFSYKGA